MELETQARPDETVRGIRLSTIADALALVCLSPPAKDREMSTGFASDVLSEVLAHAPRGCVLVTAQSSLNVIAVASYTGIAAIIVTSGYEPAEEVLVKARAGGIGLYATPAQTFDVVGKLARLGLQGPRGGSS